MNRWFVSASLMLALVWPGQLHAQGDAKDSVAFVDAAKQAFEAGRYDDAVRLLEEAYRRTKNDALLYNIGKVMHHKYREGGGIDALRRAVESYRAYLRASAAPRRRTETVAALNELEPALKALEQQTASKPPVEETKIAPARTGVAISTAAEGARIVLDNQLPSASPLVVDATPGKHHVHVSAPGYLTLERDIQVEAGTMLGLDLPLRVQPARLGIDGPRGAVVSIDGDDVGELPLQSALLVEPGERFVAVTQSGHQAFTRAMIFHRGTLVEMEADTPTTGQRYAAYATFALTGAALVAGGVMTGVALKRQADAQRIDDRRSTSGINLDELAELEQAQRDRTTFRTGAITGFAIGATAFTTGLFLYVFDEPVVTPPAKRDTVEPGAPPDANKGVELSFAPAVGPGLVAAGATLHF